MKHLLSTLTVVFAAIVMWGCSSGGGEVALTVSKSALQFSAAGGTQRVTVTAEPDLAAISSQSWCSAKCEENEVVITVKKNYSAKQRNAEVTLTAGTQTQSIFVGQAAGTGVIDAFTVSSLAFPEMSDTGRSEVTVNSLANSFTIQVMTLDPQYSWRVESDSDWLTSSVTAKHRGSGHFDFSVTPNNTIEKRKGKLTIISEYEGAKDDYQLTVIQNSTHSLQDPIEAPKIEW